MTSSPRAVTRLSCFAGLVALLVSQTMFGQAPFVIKDPATSGFRLKPEVRQYVITREQLSPAAILTPDTAGLAMLLDLHDTSLYGRVHSGPAFFDERGSQYLETRYRLTGELVAGKGKIDLQEYFSPGSEINANGWVDRGTVGFRLELVEARGGTPRIAGMFDSRFAFKREGKHLRLLPTIVEGPMMGLVQSDHPEWVTVGFETDRKCRGIIQVEQGGEFSDAAEALHHEIRIAGLRPAQNYRYRALAVAGTDTSGSPWLTFHAAPRKGAGPVVFAYAGDGRQNAGGGEFAYGGVNRHAAARLAMQMAQRQAAFLLFGGDLISGYTNSMEEFSLQLRSFRETYAPFLYTHPLYAAMGNHEALLNVFDDGTRRGFALDKWPYETASAEAVFAATFMHPLNGPQAAPGMPPYRETAYAFQYGLVRLIVLNNNYWWAAHNRIPEYGGSPEGYILPEQLDWLTRELEQAAADTTVKYVILLAQEPVFPAGGHTTDAMWYGGDNRVRAYRAIPGGSTEPYAEGMIEVRNHLWKLVSGNKKVVAMLGSDEHNYQRTLITRETPVGIPARDDVNRDSVLHDGQISPNPDFRYPTWFIVSGGGGAPYYTQEQTPWSSSRVVFSPQHHFLLFTADASHIALEVISVYGESIDRVENLAAAKGIIGK